MRAVVKASAWWVSGALTVLFGLWLYMRRFYFELEPAGDDDEE